MLQVEQINTSEMMRILAAAKNHPADRGASPFEKMRQAEVEKLSTEHDIDWFRNRLRENLEAISFDHSVVNGAVDISPEGLQAMNADRDYCNQIMNLIRHEFSSSYAPRNVSVHVSIGSTLDEYRVDTWTAADEGEFEARTAGSFYRRLGRSAAGSLADFTQGLFRQFREQLQAARAEHEQHRAAEPVWAARAMSRAVRNYEANAAYSGWGPQAAQAYEG